MFEQNITEELCVMSLKGHAIFKDKLTGGLKNDLKNLVRFHARTRKSEDFHFYGLSLFKAYKVLDKKVQKNYASWYWRVIQRKSSSLEKCIFCEIE